MLNGIKRIVAGISAAGCLLAAIPSFVVSADEITVPIKYEAEDGKLGGEKDSYKVMEDESASGGKYLQLKEHYKCEYTINVDKAGYYNVHVYSNTDKGNKEKKNSFLINGVKTTEFSSTEGDFKESVLENIKLNKGDNKVIVQKNETDWAYYNLDYFTVEYAFDADKDYYSNVSAKPVNPNATASTKRLLKYLKDSYGKYIISGQQSDAGYESSDVKSIKNVTGEEPALIGLDLMDDSPSTIKQHDGQGGAAVDRAIEISNKGGIVSICWHWRMYDEYLKSGTDDGNPRWWGAFYSRNVDMNKFKLEDAMNGKDPALYNKIVSDIDAIAVQLKKLEDADVPVLFRPLHEGGGDPRYNNPWFWWGSGGSESYIKLWKLMYDRLTNKAGLDNLIWVWNGQVASYYPGDEYVDIIGEDIYNDAGDFSPNTQKFLAANKYTSTPKMVALSENGQLMDPDEVFDSNSKWLYFMSWTGQYSVNGKDNDTDNSDVKSMWKKVYNNDKVITLSELPNLKTYPLDEDILATDIKLDKSEATLSIGDTLHIVSTFTPENATEIPTWTSSDKNVATVNESGDVTCLNVGETTITAKIKNGKTASCKITVIPVQVTDLKVKSSTSNSVTLTWSEVKDATDYIISVMDKDGKEIKSETSKTTTYEVKDLKPNTEYKFRVRAHTLYNDKDLYGEYSSIAIGKTANGTTTPNKIDTNNPSSPTIPSINTTTNNNGVSDNSANTGSAALTTIGLALAAAIVIASKKKK